MKVTVKTLKGEIYTIEVEPASTILQVKNLIKGYKDVDPELQKVVFKGKNTVNTDTMEGLGVKEADFFVVMFSNPKKDPKEKELQKKVEEKKEDKVEKKEQKQGQKKQTVSSGNAQYENSINMITGMGFDRATAVAALAAAFNDPNRAVEYCLTGIPSNADLPLGPIGDYDQQDEGMDIEGAQGVDPTVLATILNSAQFQQIRQRFQSDPTSLPQILTQIATSNPQLFSVISQHPDLFQQLLTGQVPQDMMQGMQEQQEGGEGVISLTNEQNEAIQRLSSLGFSKMEAAQAYLACDKNEELAANLLFERQGKGDIQPQGQADNDDDNLFS